MGTGFCGCSRRSAALTAVRHRLGVPVDRAKDSLRPIVVGGLLISTLAVGSGCGPSMGQTPNPAAAQTPSGPGGAGIIFEPSTFSCATPYPTNVEIKISWWLPATVGWDDGIRYMWDDIAPHEGEIVLSATEALFEQQTDGRWHRSVTYSLSEMCDTGFGLASNPGKHKWRVFDRNNAVLAEGSFTTTPTQGSAPTSQ